MANSPELAPSFPWPNGKRAACSLTFDDARLSQAERGIAVLDRYGIKGSFYVSVWGMNRRLETWKEAVSAGHEIGNHTVRHPCAYNHGTKISLEEFSLELMAEEFDAADAAIEESLGVKPRTFAYPCGHKFVGRGEGVQSYVPLAARRFLAARGFRDEFPNNPNGCDLAQLAGIDADNATFEQLKTYLERAIASGGWLVLVAHEIAGEPTNRLYTLEASVLDAFCALLKDVEGDVWTDTVANIATYVQDARSA